VEALIGERARPQDGSVDFSQFTFVQLEQLRASIDPERFPLNHANLLAELERKTPRAADFGPAESSQAVRFTPHDGLRGWLEAKRKRLSLYGPGSVTVGEAEIALNGWQRTWLGVAQRCVIAIAMGELRNFARDRDWVRLEWKRPRRLAKRFELVCETPASAADLVSRLPPARSASLQSRWAEVREFDQRVRAISPHVWATPAILLANVLAYLALVATTRRLGQFDLQQLITWGANVGSLTVDGQWWRLLSAIFLHGNLLHILLNMWAFWNVGRLAERLYGNWAFLFLYFACGALASLASIAWDPRPVSIGASGAIFGIFGAFLAFLTRRRSEVPAVVLRAHWPSTLAFVIFNLASGALQAGIDNAAHVGGLLSGFALGWALARPLDAEQRTEFSFKEALAAVMLAGAAFMAGSWQAQGFGSRLEPNDRFIRAHAWYVRGESQNLTRWQELAVAASSGSMSEAELAQRFEHEILPFWQSADQRLRKEMPSVAADQRPFASLAAEFVRVRLDWTRALIDALKNRDTRRAQEAQALGAKATLLQARLERIALRTSMDYRSRALSNSAPVVAIRRLFEAGRWNCVEEPAVFGPRVAPTDARGDGPAARDAAGCLAQRLFMSRDYVALESLIDHAAASLGDLPDGSSTLSGIFGGLSTLFLYGRLTPDETLGRTADWRRVVRGSMEPDLVEALIFDESAWAARGFGTSTQVSSQAWALFAYRVEMAAASLEDTRPLAGANPLWYELWLDVGLDQSVGLDTLRTRFDEARRRFPAYKPIYRDMLHALMPRWLGSYEKVDEFIRDVTRITERPDFALYANLYWSYDSLERDDINIFSDGLARWPTMKKGFEKLRQLYPRSDAVLNGFARFACIAGDEAQYAALRPLLQGHLSATVWTSKVSLKSCDAKWPHRGT
jgi:membrane associated rhomboid family serine protease